MVWYVPWSFMKRFVEMLRLHRWLSTSIIIHSVQIQSVFIWTALSCFETPFIGAGQFGEGLSSESLCQSRKFMMHKVFRAKRKEKEHEATTQLPAEGIGRANISTEPPGHGSAVGNPDKKNCDKAWRLNMQRLKKWQSEKRSSDNR